MSHDLLDAPLEQGPGGGGLEHLLLAERAADSVVLAFDAQHGPFRLTYRLTWDESWRLRDAELSVTTERATRSLRLETDGQGHWRHRDGRVIAELDAREKTRDTSLFMSLAPNPSLESDR